MTEPHAPKMDEDGIRVFDYRAAPRSRFNRTLIGALGAVTLGAALYALRTPAPAPIPESEDRSAPQQPAAIEPTPDQAPVAAPLPEHLQKLRAVHAQQVAKARAADPAVVAEMKKNQPQPELDAADVIGSLVAAGETEGIAAFPPPGTDPPKSGLIVPEDFALPEGYVRHYQTTDDGKQLEAILMFSPDYEFLDENGQRVPVPDDGIVPPDMAPPGLPLRRLEVPKRTTGSSGGPHGRE